MIQDNFPHLRILHLITPAAPPLLYQEAFTGFGDYDLVSLGVIQPITHPQIYLETRKVKVKVK